ncbi:MAG TPA: HU family DNA-binding protein, partial [Bacteroidales bacterium]|nr:HU family DNA-binding protein [Bacteroidales bacterium]
MYVEAKKNNYFTNPKKFFIMNKAELIDAIASEADLTKANAKKALDAFIKSTTGALKKGDR